MPRAAGPLAMQQDAAGAAGPLLDEKARAMRCILTREGRAEFYALRGRSADELARDHPWIPMIDQMLSASGLAVFADDFSDGSSVAELAQALSLVPTPANAASNAMDGRAAKATLAKLLSSDPLGCLKLWLHTFEMERYADCLAREEVDLDSVRFLTEADLKACGVRSKKHRRAILRHAATLPGNRVLAPVLRAPSWLVPAPADVSPAPAQATVPGTPQITNFFRSESGAAPKGGVAGVTAAETPRPGCQDHGGAGKGGYGVQEGTDRRPRAAAAKRPGGNERPPNYVLVAMDARTAFMVDGFKRKFAHIGCRRWILTHFHTDHYQGLTSAFDRGTIYCTHITAELARTVLGVPDKALCALPLNQPHTVDGAQLTLLDANHCPGAAMVLLEKEGCAPVLHTGDFRFHDKMTTWPELQRVRGRCKLILDTTFCQLHCVFPPQSDVVDFVEDAVRAEAFNAGERAGTLFIFGSYTLGKERVYLEVARRLKRKVFVTEAKLRVLRCIGLSPEDLALLTTDERVTNLHVMPLSGVTMRALAKLMSRCRGRFNTCIAFRPTGWAVGAKGRGTGQPMVQRRKGGGAASAEASIVVYDLPYSEHSSCPELRDFVQWLRPASIVPHVNNDGGPLLRKTLDLLSF